MNRKSPYLCERNPRNSRKNLDFEVQIWFKKLAWRPGMSCGPYIQNISKKFKKIVILYIQYTTSHLKEKCQMLDSWFAFYHPFSQAKKSNIPPHLWRNWPRWSGRRCSWARKSREKHPFALLRYDIFQESVWILDLRLLDLRTWMSVVRYVSRVCES